MRRYFLYAALCLGLMLVLGTELLSAFHALNRFGVALYWSVVLVFAFGVMWYTNALRRAFALAKIRARALKRFFAASRWRIVVVLALCAFVAALAVVALYAPPNTFDSMTYHMARVAHWQQNASVEIYPTAISRQYEYPPFAEYAILHLQMLFGDDRFANVVQFAAYLGCIMTASLISQAKGLSGNGQLAAGIITASIPMAVNEATGTQTDLVAAFWLSCAAYWILVAQEFSRRRSTLLVGLSLALAAFVKLPAVLFAVPLGFWYLFRVWRDYRSHRVLGYVALGLMLCLVVVQGPFLSRRAMVSARAFMARRDAAGQSANPALTEDLPLRYVNRRFDGAAVVSNVLRNVALHVGLPNGEWNALLTRGVRRVHQAMGINENHAATTYPARSWNRVKFYMHEDETGNFLHLLLVCGAVVWAVMGRAAQRIRWRGYVAVIAACAMLFVLVLKWEMWNSRLHTALFVLTAPLVAAWLMSVMGARFVPIVCVALLCAALPWLFWSQPRPLLGETSVLRVPRETQYFTNSPKLAEPYHNAVAWIQTRDCHNIGLWWGGNDWEYPLFALLRARGFDARIDQVHVTNASQVLEPRFVSFQPCVIVAQNQTEHQLEWNRTRYILRAAWNPLSVYEPQP